MSYQSRVMLETYEFNPGDKVEFMTFDHELADIRELDGTKATVIEVHGEDVTVNSEYGEIEADRYNFLSAT